MDDLRPDRSRPGSVRVAVGGRPAWTVAATVVAELQLVAGGPVTSAAVARLDQAADEEGAFRAALRMLERRAHGRHELGQKLLRKGHDDGVVASVLERLAALGLLDDAAFAEAYVAARAERGRGAARLRRDLTALGVAKPVVEAALGRLAGDDVPDPWRRTLEQAARRARSMKGLPRQTRHRRLAAFLARRGFTGEEARRALEELLGEQGPGVTGKG